MKTFMEESRFDFINRQDKALVVAFDAAMQALGYDFGGKIGSGYCWGPYMAIYRKTGVKSERVYARLYLREPRVVLRLFLNDIDKHRAYIEQAPAYIQEVFIGERAKCRHDHNEKDGKCRFRKAYTLHGRLIEKCNGETFEFHELSAEKLAGILALFSEFYPPRKRKK